MLKKKKLKRREKWNKNIKNKQTKLGLIKKDLKHLTTHWKLQKIFGNSKKCQNFQRDEKVKFRMQKKKNTTPKNNSKLIQNVKKLQTKSKKIKIECQKIEKIEKV